jgi:hypothetical protein
VRAEVVYLRLGFTALVDLTLVGGTFKAGEIFTGWLRKDLAGLARDEGFSMPNLSPVGGSLWLAARAELELLHRPRCRGTSGTAGAA